MACIADVILIVLFCFLNGSYDRVVQCSNKD